MLWRTIRGRVLNRFNEPLLDYGRAVHHTRSGSRPGPLPSRPTPEDAGWEEEEDRFWATSDLLHVRVERLRESHENRRSAQTVVLKENTWWAFDGGPCLTNDGDPAYEPGLSDLRFLLNPSGLRDSFTLEERGVTEIDGRSVRELGATPLDGWFEHVPELVVLGSDEYRLFLDTTIGLLIRWQAFIEGAPAREGSVSDLEVDVPLEPNLFWPPPGVPALPPPEWPAE